MPKKLNAKQREQNAIAITNRLRKLPIEVLNEIIPQNQNPQNKISRLKPENVEVIYSKGKYIVKDKNSGLIHASVSITNMNIAMRIAQHAIDKPYNPKSKQPSQLQVQPVAPVPPPFVPQPAASGPSPIYGDVPRTSTQSSEKRKDRLSRKLETAGYSFLPSSPSALSSSPQVPKQPPIAGNYTDIGALLDKAQAGYPSAAYPSVMGTDARPRTLADDLPSPPSRPDVTAHDLPDPPAPAGIAQGYSSTAGIAQGYSSKAQNPEQNYSATYAQNYSQLQLKENTYSELKLSSQEMEIDVTPEYDIPVAGEVDANDLPSVPMDIEPSDTPKTQYNKLDPDRFKKFQGTSETRKDLHFHKDATHEGRKQHAARTAAATVTTTSPASTSGPTTIEEAKQRPLPKPPGLK